ncbi:MAG: hypothetical protein ABUL62_15290 [Myxococcales bacterium]|jgi:hypothetical protein
MPEADSAARVSKCIYRRVLVASFVLGIFMPLLDWRFDLDPGVELTENRTLASAPAWPKTDAEWKALPNALQSYWNDAFGFRRRLLHWHAVAKLRLGISPTPAVVIGQHLLFFAGDGAFEQHRGHMPFPAAELSNWGTQLEARRTWLASKGAHFLFVIAPDKQSIYPEDVPARYGPFGHSPADQLVEYLRGKTQVDVLDLRTTLRAARADGPVFPATDTHWNDKGAVAAYVAIVERLRVWYPSMAPRSPASFKRYPMRRWNGDLGLMLPGLFELVAETGEQWQPVPAPAAQELANDGYHPPETSRFSEYAMASRPDLPRAVVFHDSYLLAPDERSFGQPLPTGALAPPVPKYRPRPLLAEQFSHSAFSWQYQFDPSFVEHEHPDVVIEEYVERQLRHGPQDTAVPAPP